MRRILGLLFFGGKMSLCLGVWGAMTLAMGSKEALFLSMLQSQGGDKASGCGKSGLPPVIFNKNPTTAYISAYESCIQKIREKVPCPRHDQFLWDMLVTMPAILLSFLLVLVVYVVSLAWLLAPLTGSKVIQKLKRGLLIALVGHYFFFMTIYTKYFGDPKVVFVVYPDEKMYAVNQAKLKLARWFWYEDIMVIGNLYWKGANAGLIVMVPPLSSFCSDKVLTTNYMTWIVRSYPNAHIALAGQLPSMLSQLDMSGAANRRIVNGRIGTVALARRGAQCGLEWLRRRPQGLKDVKPRKLCILGGGGYTGTEISGACCDLFDEVYLVDKKFSKQKQLSLLPDGCKVYRTSNPACVGGARVVLVFLPYGDEVEPYIKHAHRGQVWIDDTHPPISKELGERLCKVSSLFRLTARSDEMGMWPPLPNWKPQDLPGCLLTAVVVAFTNVEQKMGVSRSISLADAHAGENGTQDFIDESDKLGIALGISPVEAVESFELLNVSLLPS